MGKWVLVRTDQGGGMVAKAGHPASYTHALKYAKKFDTREDAVKDSCPGNETPVPVESLID